MEAVRFIMETQVIEDVKTRNMPLFVLKIVGNVIFYLIIIALLLFSIMNINGGNRKEGFPNIFGKGFLSVQSNSMDGDLDDSFKTGDLLLVNVFNKKDYNKLEVGQVVTFYDSNLEALNSHRIVYISRNTEGNIVSLAVQGDVSVKNFGTYDPTDDSKTQNNQFLLNRGDIANLSASDIKGVMTSIWRGTGSTLDFLQTNWLWIFVLPVLLFLIFEVFMVVKNVMALKGEKQKLETTQSVEALKADLEQQKEALRAQILAELKAEQQKEESKVEDQEKGE